MRDKLIAIAAMSLGSVVFAEINEDVTVVHESKFQPMADIVESSNKTLLEVHHSMKEICDERLKSVAIMWEMYDGFWEDRYINGVNAAYEAGYNNGYDDGNKDKDKVYEYYIHPMNDAAGDIDDNLEDRYVDFGAVAVEALEMMQVTDCITPTLGPSDELDRSQVAPTGVEPADYEGVRICPNQ